MSASATFHVQPFVHEGGRLVALRPIDVATITEAKAMMGAMVPTVPAAAAFGLAHHEDGRVWMATILGRVGDVPEEWVQTLLD